MALEIRLLNSGDEALFNDVALGVFDNTPDPVLVTQFLDDPRHHLAAAIDNGQLVGFASGVHYVHPDKSPELWINEVGVAPSHQGHGVGKAVVHALLEHGKSLGCREAWVLTERSNHRAMRLYTAVGGQEASTDQVMFSFELSSENWIRAQE